MAVGRLREGSAENALSRVSHRRGSRFKRAAQAFFASQPARCSAASKEKCECEERGLWLVTIFFLVAGKEKTSWLSK